MKFRLLFLVFLISFSLFSQVENETKLDTVKRTSLIIDHKNDQPKATISQYRIITLERDTTFVDTSLTIQSEYKYNLLRKDNFGLLSFSNEGQTYNTLDFGLRKKSSKGCLLTLVSFALMIVFSFYL